MNEYSQSQTNDQRDMMAMPPGAESKRWRRAWASFWNMVAQELYGAALDQVAKDDYEPEGNDLRLAEAMLERYCDDAGLDANAWMMWVAEVNDQLPDTELATECTVWPHTLPTPPEEPSSAASRLIKRTVQTRVEAWTASWILYHLALARAVRTAKR